MGRDCREAVRLLLAHCAFVVVFVAGPAAREFSQKSSAALAIQVIDASSASQECARAGCIRD